MFIQSVKAGLVALRQRPGLVFLLYGVNLAIAFVLAVPLYSALSGITGETGFGPELAAGFDAVLWADILEKAGPVFRALGAQLFWMAPLYLVWKVAAGVGLAHALRGRGRSFWQGVGRYTGHGLLLALGFVPLLLGLGLALVLLGVLAGILWEGEVGTFWWNVVLLPALLVGGLALLDLMHDYARIALVVDDRPVRSAFKTGVRWPFRHRAALVVYGFWFVVAALLLAAPVLPDLSTAAATAASVGLLFLLQQLFLMLRAATTVAWIGSEVALYEVVRYYEAPLIAADDSTGAPGAARPYGDVSDSLAST